MSKIINISVHQLVDFLLRKGDIDDRYFNTGTMEEGNEIHRNYQNKQKSNYLSEIDLKTTMKYGDYDVLLHGRADGIILGEIITIDEIKSTNDSIEEFNEINEEWHLGQAECYAYIYAKIHKITRINIDLTYISQINGRVFKKSFEYDFEKLERIVFGFIKQYFDFYKNIEEKKKRRDLSIKKLIFPFSLRKGQSELIKLSQNCCEKHEISFAEASTGLGKTIGMIFGSLKGLKKGNIDKIFFLCAKNSGFQSATDCLNILRNNGLKLMSIEILGKEKMCLNKNHNCNPDDCPFAKDYFTKLQDVIANTLSEYDDLNSTEILRIGSENLMCPFELSLDLSLFCDFLIMDYNYVFHPISYLKRYFDAPDKITKIFLLVDEAHNMVYRSKEMYSCSLRYSDFIKAKKSFSKIKSKPIKDIIDTLSIDFELFNDFDFVDNYVLLQFIDNEFVNNLSSYREKVKIYSKKHPKYKNNDAKDFNISVYEFLTILAFFNDTYRVFVKKEDDDFTINIKCLNASKNISEIMNKTCGAVFFSGTLTPIDYYMKSILGSNNFNTLELGSPFPKENFDLLVNNRISIRYKNRNETIVDVANLIDNFISNKIGNYIVFVPSFAYLTLLKEHLSLKNSQVFFQDNRMTNLDKELFLGNFVKNPTKTSVGFCVLGGSFSEGIDLVDDRLIGVIIIGVGMPSISFENNLIKDYYDSCGLDGFTFAYVNPGINKVMQAIGRLIRSENDRGVALLVDDRYLNKNYQSLYKMSQGQYKRVNSIKCINDELNFFYKE